MAAMAAADRIDDGCKRFSSNERLPCMLLLPGAAHIRAEGHQ